MSELLLLLWLFLLKQCRAHKVQDSPTYISLFLKCGSEWLWRMLLESMSFFRWLWLSSAVFCSGGIRVLIVKVVLNSLNHILGERGKTFMHVLSKFRTPPWLLMFKILTSTFSNLAAKSPTWSHLTSSIHWGLLNKHCAVGHEHLRPHRLDICGRQS